MTSACSLTTSKILSKWLRTENKHQRKPRFSALRVIAIFLSALLGRTLTALAYLYILEMWFLLMATRGLKLADALTALDPSRRLFFSNM